MDENNRKKSIGRKMASAAIGAVALPFFAAWAMEIACKKWIAKLGWDFAWKRMENGDFDRAVDLMDDRSWIRTKASAESASKAIETFLFFGSEDQFDAFFRAASQNKKPVALEKLSQTVKAVVAELSGFEGTFGDERLELQGETGRKSRRVRISSLALPALARSWTLCDQEHPRQKRQKSFPEPSQKHYAFHTETTNDPLDFSVRIWLMLASRKDSSRHAEAALREASIDFLRELSVAEKRVVAGQGPWSESHFEWSKKAASEMEARVIAAGVGEAALPTSEHHKTSRL